jgi:hypothetical protein
MHRILLAATLLAPFAASASTPVVLLPATGSNVHEAHVRAATDVLRAHLERTGAFTVTVVPAPRGDAEPFPVDAALAARNAGAALGVTLRIARLERNATVRLAAYAPDGRLAHVDELGAASPDDLEPVLRRLALGLAQARPGRQLAEIDTVTERETDPLRRIPATRTFGVRLGSTYLVNRAGPADDPRGAAGGGLYFLYDARSFLADLSMDLFLGDADDLFAVGLGAYYPLSRTTFTPYVGGGVAYQWLDTGGDGASGLGFKLSAGVLFGRLSTVQLRAEAGWQFAAFAERRYGQDPRAPNGPYASAGIGF